MKYKVLRRFFEIAARTGKTLNEVFAVIPNSYQDYASQIREALSEDPPEGMSRDDWAYVEALIGDAPEQVLLECYESQSGKLKYFLYDVAFEDGSVTWSNKREVEVEAALKVKPIMERRMNETVEPPQTTVVDVSDFDIRFDEEKKYATVAIAQKAEVKNRNNRVYPTDVLEDAVMRLNTRIKATGPIPMETAHRDERYIGDVCAVIHEVAFNRETGVVTLPKIEILDTTSGKNIQALLDVVPAFQVSQRGIGISHEEIDPNTGQKVTVMDWLEIHGWDMVWNGDASVEDAVLTLNENVLAGQQQQRSQEGSEGGEEGREQAGSSYFSQHGSREVSLIHESGEQQSSQQQASGNREPERDQLLTKNVLELVKTAVEQTLGPVKSTLERETSELRQKEFRRVAEDVLDTVLAQHPRFSEKQKTAIKAGIDLSRVYNQVDSLDSDSVTRALTPLLEAEIERADTLAANDVVNGWNLRNQSQNSRYINNFGGVTYHEVINDAHVSRLFDGMSFEQIVEGAIDIATRNNRMSPENPDGNWVMPINHPGMKPLAQVMDNFFKDSGAQLANETLATNVGIPVNQVSMLLVPTAWRLTTLFRFAQLHPMNLLVEDIPIERWVGQQHDVNDWERWNALDPGDNTPIPTSDLNYAHYRLACGYQPQHIRVSPRARAIAKNTVMNPIMSSTAHAAREIVNQNDLTGWRAYIMELMKYGAVKQTTFTADINLTGGKAHIADGLIPYEWIVTEDGNHNVASAGLVRNFPDDGDATASTVVGRTLEPLAVQNQAGTALDYDTDYTIDWATGVITVTASGASGVKVKYSRATNIAVWDATVPVGTTFMDHLLDLRFKISDVRAKVKDRNYEPETTCWNYGLMDKVSGGHNFSNEGTNISNAIDAMSTILRYAGSESIDTTAIPEEYIIVSEKMGLLFGMHTPFNLTGEVITDDTGNRRYFGEQFAGMGVPAPEKGGIVIVKNMPA